MENNKKNKLIILILIMIILIIGTSYAWFKLSKSSKTMNIIKSGKLSLILTEGNNINLTRAYPQKESEGLKEKPYDFKVNNNGNIVSKYTIYLDDGDIDSGDVRMNDSYIRYHLNKNGINEVNDLLSSTGINGSRVIDVGYLAPGKSNNYELRLWIDEDADSDVMDTVFSGKIRIIAEQSDNPIPEKVTVTMPKNSKTERNFTWHVEKKNFRSDVQIIKAKNHKKNHQSFNKSNVLEYSGNSTGLMFNLYGHQAKATNLEPGVKYYYRVGDKELNSWSPIGEFVTDNGDNNFQFLYMADQQSSSRGAPKAIYTMQQAMKKNKNAEFILNAGDLLNNPEKKDEWSNNLNFNVYGNLTSINAAGNHDYKYSSIGISNSLKNHFYYDLDHNNTESGLYYSMDYGNTHITVLNTNSNWYGTLDKEQLEWLKSDLSSETARNATFRIILMHRGLYTTGPHYYYWKDIQSLTNQLTSILANYNVDLVFQGHDHTYALTYPISASGERQTVVNGKVYSNEIKKEIVSMKDNKAPVYFIGGTAGTKYEPMLVKENNNYIIDPTANSGAQVNLSTEEIDEYFNKFQKIETPKDNGINLAMFSSVEINNNNLIVNSYTVNNQYYGEVKLYNSFAITK